MLAHLTARIDVSSSWNRCPAGFVKQNAVLQTAALSSLRIDLSRCLNVISKLQGLFSDVMPTISEKHHSQTTILYSHAIPVLRFGVALWVRPTHGASHLTATANLLPGPSTRNTAVFVLGVWHTNQTRAGAIPSDPLRLFLTGFAR